MGKGATKEASQVEQSTFRIPSDTIDFELGLHLVCCRCGHTGLHVQERYRNGSTLAWAKCPKCGYREEF